VFRITRITSIQTFRWNAIDTSFFYEHNQAKCFEFSIEVSKLDVKQYHNDPEFQLYLDLSYQFFSV